MLCRYWDALLYENFQLEVQQKMGKGKRERKQVQPMNMAEIHEVNNKAKKPKTERIEELNDPSVMLKQVGKGMRVFGFNLKVITWLGSRVHACHIGHTQACVGLQERKCFSQNLLRLGLGQKRWDIFRSNCEGLPQKSVTEISNFGSLFLRHLEEPSDQNAENFSDGYLKCMDAPIKISAAAQMPT